MIDLYTRPTPDGHKVHIMLEECGLPYAVHPVDFCADGQLDAQFPAISPNGTVPAIVDPDGPDGRPISLFGSGAILVWLASRTNRFLPHSARARFEALQWVMLQTADREPIPGQIRPLRTSGPGKIGDPIARHTNEARHLCAAMDGRLAQARWFVGGRYSIADIALFAWTRLHAGHDVDLDAYPGVKRWHAEISARKAVQRAVQVLDGRSPTIPDDRSRCHTPSGAA